MRRVMSSDDVARVLRRLAHEIVEHHPAPPDLVLLGVHTRGVPLADRLAALVSELTGGPVAWGSLDVAAHRDDLGGKPAPAVGATDIPGAIDGRTVVLVDDVLYTGRTVRAALDAVTDLGRPRLVQLAVLVDRGHRELPIRADYVGKNLPTAPGERVTVNVSEVDGEDGVWIEPVPVGAERGAP